MKSGSVLESSDRKNVGKEFSVLPRSSDLLPGWRIARRLRECYRAFTSELQYRLDSYEMRVSDWSHLRIIWDEEGLTQVEISKRLEIEKASSTAVLEKLRSRGLVRGERRADDRRKVGIFLTDKGRRLIDNVVPDVVAAIEKATRDIPKDDLATFTRVLDHISSNLQDPGRQHSRGSLLVDRYRQKVGRKNE